jgi:hypothetical protein
MDDLSYLTTEYARNKMIEEYNTKYPRTDERAKPESVQSGRGESTGGALNEELEAIR